MKTFKLYEQILCINVYTSRITEEIGKITFLNSDDYQDAKLYSCMDPKNEIVKKQLNLLRLYKERSQLGSNERVYRNISELFNHFDGFTYSEELDDFLLLRGGKVICPVSCSSPY